jgi:putative PIN family toxin of toxin-antitoxin system
LNGRLRSAYGHADGAVLAWRAALRKKALVVTDPLPDVGRACRDPSDDHVIAAAVVTKAEVIVTGDKDLLALGYYQLIRIITARMFVTEIADAA